MTIPTSPGWYYLKAPHCESIVCARVILYNVEKGGQILIVAWINDKGSCDATYVNDPLLVWLGSVLIPPEVS